MRVKVNCCIVWQANALISQSHPKHSILEEVKEKDSQLIQVHLSKMDVKMACGHLYILCVLTDKKLQQVNKSQNDYLLSNKRTS